ncbi:MAG: hypothetical protein GY870_11440 [archaeon]|nr:hypothetical protein [archaeon]
MKKPNILFIFPDQHRGDWLSYPPEILKRLGMSKLPLKIPNLKRLMENGVTLTNAVTPCQLYAPERACLDSRLRYD